tara:strand:+ start:32 stop:553 length:522 start_codon:yes stop_codon:yes gene_type:complete
MAGRKKTKERRLAQDEKLDNEKSSFWDRLFIAIGGEGLSLSEYCKLENVEYNKVSWRLKRSEDLSQLYRQARENRASIHAERIADLSEEVLKNPKDANAYKISIDSKKWLASVMDRQTFGDKVEQNVNMNIDLNSTYLDQLKDLMQNKPKIVNESKKESKKLDEPLQVIDIIS